MNHDMSEDEAREYNRQANVIHTSDNFWAEAQAHLEKILTHFKKQETAVYDLAGNTDPSVFFIFACE